MSPAAAPPVSSLRGNIATSGDERRPRGPHQRRFRGEFARQPRLALLTRGTLKLARGPTVGDRLRQLPFVEGLELDHEAHERGEHVGHQNGMSGSAWSPSFQSLAAWTARWVVSAGGLRLILKLGYVYFAPSTSPTYFSDTISPGSTRPRVSTTTSVPRSLSHSSTSPSTSFLVSTTPPTRTDQFLPSRSTPARDSASPNLVCPVDQPVAWIVSGLGASGSRYSQGLPVS